MLHEIAPHEFNNQYQAGYKSAESDYILHYRNNMVVLKQYANAYHLPQKSDFKEVIKDSSLTFLFTFNKVACFLFEDEFEVTNEHLRLVETNFFRTTQQQAIAWVVIAGYHLQSWYTQNKFCGRCGSPTLHKQTERALECHKCKHTIYPRISPAIIVAIVCNDKILLARNTSFIGGWYSLIAGYADIGESLEETVRREVKEEVGIDVTNIRYYNSQPWPPSGSIMIGFVAEADANQAIIIDGNEIAEAAWFSRGGLPKHSLNLSIAGEMIEKFERNEL